MCVTTNNLNNYRLITVFTDRDKSDDLKEYTNHIMD